MGAEKAKESLIKAQLDMAGIAMALGAERRRKVSA